MLKQQIISVAIILACCSGTAVPADEITLPGLEDLAKVKRILVEVASDTAVLNADDPLCLKMADHTEAERICYVTMQPRHSLVREHIRAGGRAVVLEEA